MKPSQEYQRGLAQALGQLDVDHHDVLQRSFQLWGIPRVTAACISKPFVFIATLERSQRDSIRICPHGTGHCRMADRSQVEIRSFFREARRFFLPMESRLLFLRVGSERGQRLQNPHHFKMETALQLLPEVTVELVHTQVVIGWVNRERPRLPEAWEPSLGRVAKDAQRRAIETSAFILAGSGIDHSTRGREQAYG